MSSRLVDCSILILAGGRGQRMGGRDKGLVEWQGLPLVEHMHRVIRPLTDDLILSCNRNAGQYAPYADRLVSDAEPDFPGPLAGIRAGLAVAQHRWLIVLPCDAPRIDAALLHQLAKCARQTPDQPIMVRQGSFWEPLFSVIPTALRSKVEKAWQAGERSPRGVLLPLKAQALHLEETDKRLANMNDERSLTDSSQ
ncbi:molybdopterin-guanine dinucleotide biosynthesis protein A [Pseudomonas duriflava]|uniref:Molybdenum cofactor guanylyltransferase n=1 Tax=Pseudomonas duriflava TaxID=459528 RepID=A0A562Q8C3_9PSED|nr:molybdenum cofactor guanylyltransferase MobA [Pseudomonas duriflava]TWI53005.1 molybdopterin-guanine dinucleotide biosynthesis protein A [Pseudomonas duriflava]